MKERKKTFTKQPTYYYQRPMTKHNTYKMTTLITPQHTCRLFRGSTHHFELGLQVPALSSERRRLALFLQSHLRPLFNPSAELAELRLQRRALALRGRTKRREAGWASVGQSLLDHLHRSDHVPEVAECMDGTDAHGSAVYGSVDAVHINARALAVVLGSCSRRRELASCQRLQHRVPRRANLHLSFRDTLCGS